MFHVLQLRKTFPIGSILNFLSNQDLRNKFDKKTVLSDEGYYSSTEFYARALCGNCLRT